MIPTTQVAIMLNPEINIDQQLNLSCPGNIVAFNAHVIAMAMSQIIYTHQTKSYFLIIGTNAAKVNINTMASKTLIDNGNGSALNQKLLKASKPSIHANKADNPKKAMIYKITIHNFNCVGSIVTLFFDVLNQLIKTIVCMMIL